MHPEKGSFKVKRLKPYFRGDFQISKHAITLSALGMGQ